MWQLDVAAHGRAARFKRSAISGFHNARAAARNDGVTRARQQGAGLLRGAVLRIVWFRPSGAEHRDSIRDVCEVLKALDELAHDAEDSPRIRVQKLIRVRSL